MAAKYVLDMKKPHRQSFIELVNNDNAATVGVNLTLGDVLLKDERALEGEEKTAHGDRQFGLTLENAKYAADKVEVFFNKVALADVMDMTIEDGDFDWYAPDDWDASTSPALAITAFKAAAVRAGIDPEAALEALAVERYHDVTTNHYRLKFTLTSLVFQAEVEFQMPKHFSDVVTVTKLNGFVFTPIAAEDVVF